MNYSSARALRRLGAELESYYRTVGLKPLCRLVETFIVIVRWVREYGHGRIILSAVDRLLGTKIEFQTYESLKTE